ncbi:MAG: hypothetical protein IPI16_01735 [Comamonadaceae bacterium]|jgi:hypothetical protein|nr:hypothetical protein [Comamonadaceae bacterium]
MPHTQTGWKSPAAANPNTRRVERNAAQLIGIETRLDLGPASARYTTDARSEASWAANGTLTGAVACVSLADEPPGTSISIAACGGRALQACLFSNLGHLRPKNAVGEAVGPSRH